MPAPLPHSDRAPPSGPPEDAPGGRLVQRLRRLAPMLLAGAFFVLGLLALRHLLAETNPRAILVQAAAVPWIDLAVALAATGFGYGALILYDRVALDYLGRRVPARAVALGGFLGYAFGNTLGISAISGGAVRFRVYSAFGLGALDVAGLSAFISIAAGLGVSAIGLAGLIWAPSALAHLVDLSPATTRLLAIAALAALGGGLAWLSLGGRTLRLKGLEIAAPAPRIVLAQLAVTVIDTSFAALALWILLPAGAPDFASFLPIFAAGMMIGVVSHVPGGIGVFETIVIAAMPSGPPLAQVTAALLLFRVIYYLLPFALALVVLAFNEARLAGGVAARIFGEISAPMRPAVASLKALIPSLTGVVSLAAGVYLVLIALMPAVRPHTIDPRDILGAILLEGGAALSAMIGVVLVMLSQALIRRISGSYWLLQSGLLAGALVSALNDFDIESSALLLVVAIILTPFRGQFTRAAKLTRGVLSPAWFALVLAIVLSLAGFFFFMHRATPWSGSLWTEFAGGSDTPRSLRAGLLASALLVLGTVWLAMRPVRAHTRRPEGAALDRARAVIAGSDEPMACLALTGDKALYFDESDRAFIAYAVQGRSWIALGDPVGPAQTARDLAWAFFDEAWAGNGRPAFYGVSDRYLPLWVEMGFTLHKLGEEAVISLPDFSLSGSGFKTMRAAHNKARKSGLALEVLPPPHAPALLAELAEVSEAWLRGKTGAEKGFSVGRFTPAFLNEGPVAVVRREGRLLGFATVLAPGTGQHLAVDLMRYRPEERGMMEFIFVSLLEHYRDAGAQSFSLGMAPLSGLQTRPGARLWTRFGSMIFRHGGPIYNFEGLRAFKQKFRPDWQPRFLAVQGGTQPLLWVLTDATVLIAGGVRGIVGKGRGG
ncbi:bifunctional lysylphosphatidylglycerol flippase/synthetase MprF [Frigidibacter sp. ROC022]|uniref:bifunctional lysylphosphatidylglycerol flippase/synthetase MprF n=1 Tax=Frigidibacter sp. ROC022 TaxID=2971796 RepID=UPI00215ADF43|nr:bifunctional lysylphosphatidylglycerol flippase/synthetase MprF [Frigidibacter sp. ROC022]MCR8723813.1 bifunctional lysylphosphatidylglycerol flippase/synthetase MprF [Frigidibacter sp. ROC022]